MAEKMETREAVAKMAQQVHENSRGTVSREDARKIAERAARRVDHNEGRRK